MMFAEAQTQFGMDLVMESIADCLNGLVTVLQGAKYAIYLGARMSMS